MLSLDDISSHLEIRQVLATYSRGVDRWDAEILKSVYHPDAIDKHTVFNGTGWDFAEDWTMDLEGRYASEEIAYSGGNGCTTANTYYNLTPRLSFTFKPTADLRFYVQAANGDKPGDVNGEFFRGDVHQSFCREALANTSDVLIKPEEQWTYEVGAKTQWFDRRLIANLAVYVIDWSKQSIFQIQNFGAYDFPGYQNTETLSTTIVRNVGNSRNIGGELETTFAVTDELTLVANYGYTHAKFTDGEDSTLANLTGNGDVSGKWIPSAPEHSVVLSGILRKPIGADTIFTLRTDYSYNSKQYNQTNNFSWIGASTLVNLRMGFEQGLELGLDHVAVVVEEHAALGQHALLDGGQHCAHLIVRRHRPDFGAVDFPRAAIFHSRTGLFRFAGGAAARDQSRAQNNQ